MTEIPIGSIIMLGGVEFKTISGKRGDNTYEVLYFGTEKSFLYAVDAEKAYMEQVVSYFSGAPSTTANKPYIISTEPTPAPAPMTIEQVVDYFNTPAPAPATAAPAPAPATAPAPAAPTIAEVVAYFTNPAPADMTQPPAPMTIEQVVDYFNQPAPTESAPQSGIITEPVIIKKAEGMTTKALITIGAVVLVVILIIRKAIK